MDRRPLSLLESAESCKASLEKLKKHASDSKAKHTHSTKKRQLLEKVNSDVCPFYRSIRRGLADESRLLVALGLCKPGLQQSRRAGKHQTIPLSQRSQSILILSNPTQLKSAKF